MERAATVHSERVMTADLAAPHRQSRTNDMVEAYVGVPGSNTNVDQATGDMLMSLALGDSGVLGEAAQVREQLRADSTLEPKTFALVKIAALVALDAPPASYLFQVQMALDAGASAREILGVLTAIAPQTGMPRVVAAAPEIMIALGLELPADADV
jgi:alkylhydroperoxidase/carboxymuconolactone decarboxylase family protein YurZ